MTIKESMESWRRWCDRWEGALAEVPECGGSSEVRREMPQGRGQPPGTGPQDDARAEALPGAGLVWSEGLAHIQVRLAAIVNRAADALVQRVSGGALIGLFYDPLDEVEEYVKAELRRSRRPRRASGGGSDG